MRRMFTNKNVVDIVNQGIESGEITVEGGLPEIEAGDAGKVLAVNSGETGTEWITPASGGDSPLTTFSNSSWKVNDYSDLLQRVSVYSGNQSGGSSWSNALLLSAGIPSQAGTVLRDYYSKEGTNSHSSLFISTSLNNAPYGTIGVPGGTGLWAGSLNSSTSSDLGKFELDGSILLTGTNYNFYTSSRKNIKLHASIMIGVNQYTQPMTSWPNSEIYSSLLIGCDKLPQTAYNIIAAGYRLSLVSSNDVNLGYAGKAVFGKFNSPFTGASDSDMLIVGAGTSDSDRANCFAAGNDSTNGDYIKIGNTMITEAQLQALLATLS